MAHPSVFIHWHETGLLPTDGMEFWNQFVYAEGASGVAYDYSGNNRHIIAGATPPVLTFDLWRNQAGWVFDGTNDPLTYSEPGGIIAKHVFVFAAYQDAAFSTNERGLLSGPTGGSILASETSGDQFYDLYPGGGVIYKKSDVTYATASATAPMNGVPELIEWQRPAAVVMDGIQVGQQIGLTARKWIGPWFEHIGYSRVLNYEERRRVLLYFALRYQVNIQGVPLYAPTADLVPTLATQARVHNRFYDEPQDWQKITQQYVFEDESNTTNEVADSTVRRWNYVYQNVPKAQKPVFDTFNDTARRSKFFYFKDPEGLVWSSVKIREYQRNHDAHKRWRNDVEFDFEGSSASDVYAFESPPVEEAPPVEPEFPEGTVIWEGEPVMWLEDGADPETEAGVTWEP